MHEILIILPSFAPVRKMSKLFISTFGAFVLLFASAVFGENDLPDKHVTDIIDDVSGEYEFNGRPVYGIENGEASKKDETDETCCGMWGRSFRTGKYDSLRRPPVKTFLLSTKNYKNSETGQHEEEALQRKLELPNYDAEKYRKFRAKN